MLLKSINPATKTKNRGEQAAAEILGRELDQKDHGAVLLFEDAAVRKANYLTRLPDRVVVTSTSEFLFGLESRGLLHDAQGILMRAVDVRGNEVLARHLDGSDGSEPVQDWADRLAPS